MSGYFPVINIENSDVMLDEIYIDQECTNNMAALLKVIGMSITNNSFVYIPANYKSRKQNYNGVYDDNNIYFSYGGMSTTTNSSIFISSLYIGIYVDNYSKLLSNKLVPHRIACPCMYFYGLLVANFSRVNLYNFTQHYLGNTNGSCQVIDQSFSIYAYHHSEVVIDTGAFYTSGANASYGALKAAHNSHIIGSSDYYPIVFCNYYQYNYVVLHQSSITFTYCNYAGVSCNMYAAHLYDLVINNAGSLTTYHGI